MKALLKMILYVVLYKIWADFAKRKGLYWKSVSHIVLHKDGSCIIRRIGDDGYEDVEGFPWIFQNFWRVVKWWIKEIKEIREESRPHWMIFSDRLKQINDSQI